VCEALQGVPGVTRVQCDPQASSVDVEFDANSTSVDVLQARVSGLGRQVAETVAHAAWRISGLD